MVKKILLLAFLVGILSCKRGELEHLKKQDDQSVWVVMSNATDPLFTIIKKDLLELELYGERNESGIPANLNTIICKSDKDTIYFHFDKKGRPVSVRTNNGLEYKYSWYNETLAYIDLFTSDKRFYLSGKISVNNIIDENPGRLRSGQVGLNVFRCEAPEQSTYTVIGMELRDQLVESEPVYIPTTFTNGVYAASVPQDVLLNISSTPQGNQTFADAISGPSKVRTPAGKSAVSAACAEVIALMDSSGFFGEPAKQEVYHSGHIIGKAFDLYSSIIENVDIPNKLAKATWTRRVYGEEILLTPFAYWNGLKIFGERTLFKVGPEQKNISFDYGCPASDMDNTIWQGSYVSNEQPDVEVPVYLKLTVGKDLRCRAEWSNEAGDYSKFFFEGEIHRWGQYIIWSNSSDFNFALSWIITNLNTLKGSVNACFGCNSPAKYTFTLRRKVW